MSLAQLLVALATPLARRVFIALGLAWVVYEGVSTSIDLLLTNAAAQMLGLPPDVLALLNLAGVFDGLGLLTGAFVARLAMIPLAQIIPNQGAAS
jgi:Protein of unknown function (DUF2523)